MNPLSLSIRDTVDGQSRARGKNVRAHGITAGQIGRPRILNNGLFFCFFFDVRDAARFVLVLRCGSYISRPTHKFIARLISANKTAHDAAAATRCRTSAPRPVSRYNRHFSPELADSSRVPPIRIPR